MNHTFFCDLWWKLVLNRYSVLFLDTSTLMDMGQIRCRFLAIPTNSIHPKSEVSPPHPTGQKVFLCAWPASDWPLVQVLLFWLAASHSYDAFCGNNRGNNNRTEGFIPEWMDSISGHNCGSDQSADKSEFISPRLIHSQWIKPQGNYVFWKGHEPFNGVLLHLDYGHSDFPWFLRILLPAKSTVQTQFTLIRLKKINNH